MKKVLIITYYWAPSGGAGVQRWLKLSKYLAQLGVEVHVLTVDPEKASYSAIDTSLSEDVDPKVTVHTSDSFEIINYYSKLVGKKNVPTAGFSNVDNDKFFQKAANSIRSNFFIPDPRIGWKKHAVKKAKQILKEHSIETIITTSPPHSTQIIGLELKKQLDLHWIVDFRDPWTDIYYYNLLGHTKLSKSLDKRLEKKVVEQSDQIVTVSYGFKDIFLSKSTEIKDSKIVIIPNGFDPDDFNQSLTKNTSAHQFVITYTGTMSSQYDPFIFFDALNDVVETEFKVLLKIVGSISDEIKLYLKNMKFDCEFVPTVPHNEISQYQKDADILLLVIPNIKMADGITPGKLFEYIASENPVIALGAENSDVNRILNECEAGKTFQRENKQPITDYITELIELKRNSIDWKINHSKFSKYSRINQAESIKLLLK